MTNIFLIFTYNSPYSYTMHMTKDGNASKTRSFVTTSEAAKMLGVSYYTVYEYIKEERLPAELVGGIYMLPKGAVEQFKPKPTGRTRTKPALWRMYRAGAIVLEVEIRVQVRAGQQERLVEKLNEIQEEQRHTFSGTMQRYVFEDDDALTSVTISLIWKDTEMPDEATRQRDLAAFRAELANVLDWETAQYNMKRAIIHT